MTLYARPQRPKPLGPPHTRGECDFCRWPMKNSDRVAWNGGVGHARCVAEHERVVLGDDAGPGLLEHLDGAERVERLATFMARLYAEAEAMGIERARLSAAVDRALGINASRRKAA